MRYALGIIAIKKLAYDPICVWRGSKWEYIHYSAALSRNLSNATIKMYSTCRGALLTPYGFYYAKVVSNYIRMRNFNILIKFNINVDAV